MPPAHPPEFRARASSWRLNAPLGQIAKDLGISESCLRGWVAQADIDQGRPGGAHGCPVAFARDCMVLDFATHSDLTGRLHGLVILLGSRLTLDQARSADKLIDASEFELALEKLADWLSEDETAIPDDVRRDFEKISLQMGNVERVMRPLDLCPAEAEE
jgi:hypothetical protein